jgi:ribosomal protein L28
MSYVCQICDKKTVAGRSQKHRRGVAGKRWRKRAQVTLRVFKPNLQKVSLRFNDTEVKEMRICTKCLKRIKKYKSIGDFSNVSVV